MERPPTAHTIKSTTRKEDEGNTSEFSAESRPASRRGTRTAQLQRVCYVLPLFVSTLTQKTKNENSHLIGSLFSQEASVRGERTLSRDLSTATQESQWRPGSGVARIQGTASRLLSAATQHKGSSVIINTPRLDTSQVSPVM